ncbi:hypothetical protein SAMN06295905_2249 [Devosia lucknowensis]|uniref:J domain-containing protein n=1 Tax=Devosia lucknowensis TaxID=1096929 RepID=A0A1Y6FDY6_9HYPH|nr:hypothetical protein [Devosia lucknowensis]SMQ73065.1 hypothetical protein SAMN06295905_2249 [Devosia lucknowensis]
MSAEWPWSALGLDEPATGERDIKRAYAARLRLIDIDRDIAGFEALRAAYDAALDRLSTSAADSGPSFSGQHPDFGRIAAPDSPEADERDAESSIGKIIWLLQSRHFAPDAWQPLLTAPDIDTPALQQYVESLLVRDLELGLERGNAPSLTWIDLVDRHFGWSEDSVGFARRHPASRHLLSELYAAYDGAPARHTPVRARPLPLALRWYALVGYTVLIFAFHALMFV